MVNNEEIRQSIIDANEKYRNGTSFMSDYDYDKLVELAKERECYPFEGVEPEELYKGHIKHLNPLLSTQKAKTNEDMNKWFGKVLDSARKVGLKSLDVEIKATEKLDGIASVFYNSHLVTRGNGIEGNDITDKIKSGLVMPKCYYQARDLTIPVLGELVVDLEYFNEYLSDEFSNARNFVSGLIMSDTISSSGKVALEKKQVYMKAYNELPCSITSLLYSRTNLRDIEKEVSSFGTSLIDGVVFEVVNPEIKEEMGRNDHHNHWQIALKPSDTAYTTTIKDIEWNCGRTGKCTPVLIVETVDIDGVNVSRCTGHNAKMVVEHDLKPGVKIEIIRSGSVIPKFERVVK